jgi:CubicO group peptidase (beta-lactamase class C family)
LLKASSPQSNKPSTIIMLSRNLLACCTSLALTIMNLNAQEDSSSELFRILEAKDDLLFNVGFNTCDLKQFDTLVSEDFEFYHDTSGINPSKAAFLDDMKNGVCKGGYHARRELEKGSLRVYPLRDKNVLYGAIQTGRHRFYEGGKDNEHLSSVATFTHLWRLENGDWRLSRVLSYDHQTKENPEKKASTLPTGEEIQQLLSENHVPALGLGIIRDGALQQVQLFGRLQHDVPAPYNTIFNVASLTKPVVTLITLKMVSRGEWNLDEPLSKYWTDPDVSSDPRHEKLTTRHVLSQQTGFPNWRRLSKSKKLAFEFEPGTRYQYSGEGFEYLRRALEKKTGRSLEQLASSLIFAPLDMRDTRFVWDKNVDQSRFAVGHDNKGNPYEIIKNQKANAADDLLTTVGDYGRFLVSVMNAEGLSKEVFNDMVRHQVKVKENKFFGLGWEIYDNLGNGEYALGHGGADEGVRTQVFILPKSKQGLVIMTNGDAGDNLYEKLLEAYLQDLGKNIVKIEMQ